MQVLHSGVYLHFYMHYTVMHLYAIYMHFWLKEHLGTKVRKSLYKGMYTSFLNISQ